MKRSIYFLFLFCLYSNGIVLAVDVPVKSSPLPPPYPYPKTRGVGRTAITADLNQSDLIISFPTNIGIATITVTDETGGVVFQQTIDTASSPDLYISIDSWDAGNYTLIIVYDSTTLTGNFTL